MESRPPSRLPFLDPLCFLDSEAITSRDSQAVKPALSRAPLLSRLSFGWLTPLFDAGALRQLSMGDIDVLPASDATAVAVSSMRLRLLQVCCGVAAWGSADVGALLSVHVCVFLLYLVVLYLVLIP
jgi:hypothetical protein